MMNQYEQSALTCVICVSCIGKKYFSHSFFPSYTQHSEGRPAAETQHAFQKPLRENRENSHVISDSSFR